MNLSIQEIKMQIEAYSKRAVAYIDILCFSAEIKRALNGSELQNNLIQAIHNLRSPYYDEYLSQVAIDARRMLGGDGERPKEPKVTQFSESIVISRP